MGYMHIENLYKNQDILLFKECYALEKIHGTSAHISWHPTDRTIKYFSGGEIHEKFVALFDNDVLYDLLVVDFPNIDIIVYGEAYGGKQQGMSHTYGKDLKFIVFDVKVGDSFVDVPNAHQIAEKLGLDFVYYTKIPTDMKYIDAERDNPSVQAVRNGVGEDKVREGVVLRPLMELTKNNGVRVICKHKGEKFGERKSQPKVDTNGLEILSDARKVADEWVTAMRLEHVLDKHPDLTDMEHTSKVIEAVQEDIKREGEGEIEWSKEVAKQIGHNVVILWKQKFKDKLLERVASV